MKNTIEFKDVVTTQETVYGKRKRLYILTPVGDNFWVYEDEICANSEVKTLGDRGMLVIPIRVAIEHGVHPSFGLDS